MGTQLQLLAAHDDREFLETLAGMINQRVRNVLAMESERARTQRDA